MGAVLRLLVTLSGRSIGVPIWQVRTENELAVIYEYLEAEGFLYAICLPANKVLQTDPYQSLHRLCNITSSVAHKVM